MTALVRRANAFRRVGLTAAKAPELLGAARSELFQQQVELTEIPRDLATTVDPADWPQNPAQIRIPRCGKVCIR
jgi:hypothetical protein